MKGRDSGTLPPQLVSGSVRNFFPFIFGSNSSSKVANYQRYLIPAILTIYSHDYPRENLLLSGKGTFSCMSFTFVPLVGVEYFRAFFGRERCVLCFCALKTIGSGHPLIGDRGTQDILRLRESSNFCYSTHLKQKLQGTKVTAIYTWISQ